MKRCIVIILFVIFLIGCLICYREKSETFIGSKNHIENNSLQKSFNVVLEYLQKESFGSYYIIKVNDIKSSGSKIKGDLMIMNKSNATVNRYNIQVSVPMNDKSDYVVDFVKFFNETNDTYMENMEKVNLNSSELDKKYFKAVKE